MNILAVSPCQVLPQASKHVNLLFFEVCLLMSFFWSRVDDWWRNIDLVREKLMLVEREMFCSHTLYIKDVRSHSIPTLVKSQLSVVTIASLAPWTQSGGWIWLGIWGTLHAHWLMSHQSPVCSQWACSSLSSYLILRIIIYLFHQEGVYWGHTRALWSQLCCPLERM